MSVKVSNWGWHEARDREGAKLTGNLFILLLALADVADDDGSCLRFTPDKEGLTYDALATKTGVDRRTIIRLVARLKEERLVEHRPGVKGRANEFVVLVPWYRKNGDRLSPNAQSDSVTTATDSVTNPADSVTEPAQFGDKPGSHSSYRREDVADVRDVGARTRGTPIPEPFIVTASMREWAAHEVPGLDVDQVTRVFVDYWRAATRNAAKKDWPATWRNWLRKDYVSHLERGGKSRQSKDDRARSVIEMGRRMDAGRSEISA